jgi:hypothetical protein
MSDTMEDISGKMDTLENLDPMLSSMRNINLAMEGMNYNMGLMTVTGDQMRQEVGSMGHSMRPMNFMNNFVPW